MNLRCGSLKGALKRAIISHENISIKSIELNWIETVHVCQVANLCTSFVAILLLAASFVSDIPGVQKKLEYNWIDVKRLLLMKP